MVVGAVREREGHALLARSDADGIAEHVEEAGILEQLAAGALDTLEQRLGGSDPVTPPQPKGGDPDGDGAVTNKDAQTVLIAYTGSLGTGKVDLPEDALKAADVNGDGKVGVDDAQYILIYYTENTIAGNPTTWEDVIQ